MEGLSRWEGTNQNDERKQKDKGSQHPATPEDVSPEPAKAD